jgi:hypothetical protein
LIGQSGDGSLAKTKNATAGWFHEALWLSGWFFTAEPWITEFVEQA